MIWRGLLFLLFAMLGTPLEYNVHWIEPWSRGVANLGTALDIPLVHGALLFYSVILATEAYFRLEMYPHRAKRWGCQALRLLCMAACVPFFVYLVRGLDLPLDGWWITMQWYTAGITLFISFVVFCYLERVDKLVYQRDARHVPWPPL